MLVCTCIDIYVYTLVSMSHTANHLYRYNKCLQLNFVQRNYCQFFYETTFLKLVRIDNFIKTWKLVISIMPLFVSPCPFTSELISFRPEGLGSEIGMEYDGCQGRLIQGKQGMGKLGFYWQVTLVNSMYHLHSLVQECTSNGVTAVLH